ncbi:ABC transporter ATP-binding protein [Macrococcus hajekii]|uniref:ABC transporter ATP-binding protein n=1 Tax=Macrococcus hajekii TaxID=198482 RepID=A0A4V3BEM0_9STAP|nr:ABC transporter ATP-binding protein [Macrococcus hajekii]TDM03125.1 ABC transporter ATP-binding protein [Macrococcus hajekii]GGA96169.1 putative ABC transporter ATP-binding protein YfiC [Macrococcus hajekii]
MIKQVFTHQPILKKEDIGRKKDKKRAENWKDTVRRIWWLMEHRKWLVLIVILLVIMTSLLGLIGPYIIGHIIDHNIMTKEFDSLGQKLLLLIAVFTALSLLTYVSAYMMVGIAQETVYKLRMQLFSHMQKLPIRFFDERQHGEIMSRMTNDIENMSKVLNSSFIQFTSSIVTLLGTVIVMLTLSPLLTLLTMVIIPVMFLATRWITNRTGPLYKMRQQALGEMNAYIEEIISGQSVVKVFSQENAVIDGFEDKNRAVRERGFWSISYSGFIPKVMNGLNNVSFAIVIGIGGLLALNGQGVTVGTIVIFAEYARQFTRPLSDLANQFNEVLSALAGAERVFSIIDEKEEPELRLQQHTDKIIGDIAFKDVTFKYNDNQQNNVIHHISFNLPAGESLALVGATGAGKTTIIQLLNRFYDITGGSIEIDGRLITDIPRDFLRRQIAYVLQDPVLFDGTIRDNIKYGDHTASDDKIIQAAKNANAHDFIMRLQDGYDTLISGEESQLSQGEKQLLSIARALVQDPVILLLDEATSSIDTVTEMKLQEAIDRLMAGRTSIIIAHRLNTVKKADKVVVLAQGEIIEQGYQQELLKQNGLYSQMVHSSAGDFDELLD